LSSRSGCHRRALSGAAGGRLERAASRGERWPLSSAVGATKGKATGRTSLERERFLWLPTLRRMRSALRFLKRVIRAVRIAGTDKRIPRPLRWLAALGIAPIPGPFDEALLLIVAIPLALFYRGPLGEAWSRADIANPS
jgi:hypothetical protein